MVLHRRPAKLLSLGRHPPAWLTIIVTSVRKWSMLGICGLMTQISLQLQTLSEEIGDPDGLSEQVQTSSSISCSSGNCLQPAPENFRGLISDGRQPGADYEDWLSVCSELFVW